MVLWVSNNPLLVNGRLRSIDCLRGAAALAVVLEHAFGYGAAPNSSSPWFGWVLAITSRGHLGVPLFFVISGFCIHLSWAKQKAQTGTAAQRFIPFWKRRIRRLYPPYFVTLLLSMGLVAVAIARGIDVPIATYPKPHLGWAIGDFFAHALMLHGLIPAFDRMGGNPPFWTLAREEYLYAMYFVLLALRSRFNARLSTLVSGIAGIGFYLAMLKFAGTAWWPIIAWSAIVLWIQWALGMLAVEAYFGLVQLPALFTRWWLVPLWWTAAEFAQLRALALAPLLWGLCFFTLLNAVTGLEKMGQWPRSRVVAWLTSVGVFSYSLYLVHYPIRGVVKFALPGHGATSSPLLFTGYALLMSAAGYVGAWVFFHLVERHFLTGKSAPERALAASVQLGRA